MEIVEAMTDTETMTREAATELGNLKVLLAEDNEVNQLLAKNILHYWGLNWKIARNGNQVIQLLQAEDFDIILMDIQMPEKSGIEAAEEIRSLTDTRKNNVPIIALTANAVMGEEKKYFAAGINDFLTKPFKKEALYEVMLKVMKSRKDNCIWEKEELQLEAQNYTSMSKLYNLSYLEDLGGNNPAFIASLIQIYIDTTPADSSEMKKACAEKKWDHVSKLAHKIKSTIDSLQIVTIKDDVRTIELDAKNKVNLEAVCRLVAKVDDVINEAAAQLKLELQQQGSY